MLPVLSTSQSDSRQASRTGASSHNSSLPNVLIIVKKTVGCLDVQGRTTLKQVIALLNPADSISST